jgi:hypothetical protein
MALKPGDAAPDFAVASSGGENFRAPGIRVVGSDLTAARDIAGLLDRARAA